MHLMALSFVSYYSIMMLLGHAPTPTPCNNLTLPVYKTSVSKLHSVNWGPHSSFIQQQGLHCFTLSSLSPGTPRSWGQWYLHYVQWLLRILTTDNRLDFHKLWFCMLLLSSGNCSLFLPYKATIAMQFSSPNHFLIYLLIICSTAVIEKSYELSQ